MHTVPYKGEDWPVSPEWAEKHLAGAFADMTRWETGVHEDSGAPFDPEQPALWPKLWGLLRKSDETFARRTAGMTHKEVAELMLYSADPSEAQRENLLALDDAVLLERYKLTREDILEWAPDPERTAKAREITETLSPEEMRELRAAEAHIIVRQRIDFLLGRELAEFDIDYIDHAHGQGYGPPCGCVMLTVVDDKAVAEGRREGANRKTHHAHYPKQLCPRHAHLMVVLSGKGPLTDKLEHVHRMVLSDQPRGEAA